jgi:hypothetical protein
MSTDRTSVRRMTLRQLLTSAEKHTRDLTEQLQVTLLSRFSDFRDLNRPVRKKSHFPSMVALFNSLAHLEQTSEEIEGLTDFLLEELREIREHARRERLNRR